jgi:hypothetical protein
MGFRVNMKESCDFPDDVASSRDSDERYGQNLAGVKALSDLEGQSGLADSTKAVDGDMTIRTSE